MLITHRDVLTFREIAQSTGFFLVALVNEWVAIVMSARRPEPIIYFDARSRYGIAFGLLYFLVGAIGVDVVLQRYWASATATSEEKLTDLSQVRRMFEDDNKLSEIPLQIRLVLTLPGYAINVGEMQ